MHGQSQGTDAKELSTRSCICCHVSIMWDKSATREAAVREAQSTATEVHVKDMRQICSEEQQVYSKPELPQQTQKVSVKVEEVRQQVRGPRLPRWFLFSLICRDSQYSCFSLWTGPLPTVEPLFIHSFLNFSCLSTVHAACHNSGITMMSSL